MDAAIIWTNFRELEGHKEKLIYDGEIIWNQRFTIIKIKYRQRNWTFKKQISKHIQINWKQTERKGTILKWYNEWSSWCILDDCIELIRTNFRELEGHKEKLIYDGEIICNQRFTIIKIKSRQRNWTFKKQISKNIQINWKQNRKKRNNIEMI